MSRPHRQHAILLAAVVGLLVAAGPVAGAAAGAGVFAWGAPPAAIDAGSAPGARAARRGLGAAQRQAAEAQAGRSVPAQLQPDRAFGYDLGEERRYILGPERSLRGGESAWWSIVLHDIQGEGEDTRIVFDLEHERSQILYDIFGGETGRMQTVNVDGRLTVNRFGFPLRLVISEQLDVHGETGSLSDLRTTVFAFDGERMVKEVRIDGREWDFRIAIASDDDLDLELPAGMFPYVPKGLRCLGGRGQIGRPMPCPEGDPAFANPGLLSLALPVMWEEQVNERRFLFFMPNGVGTVPGGLMDMNRLMARERDHLANYTRYFDKTEIEVKEFAQRVEVGPRFLDAWKLDGSGEMSEFYADDDGRVLKVQIDPHPITRGERWIRLQFPSEY